MTLHADSATSVTASVEVAVPPERAFEVFTTGIDTWWTRSHHVLPGELKQMGVDPQPGGRMWEENDAGEICVWGRVLTWDPPRTFAFSWLIGPDWGVPTAEAPASRVTVTFTPTGAGTRVIVQHDDLDAHGPGWEGVRAGVASEGGWPGLLRQMAGVAASGA